MTRFFRDGDDLITVSSHIKILARVDDGDPTRYVATLIDDVGLGGGNTAHDAIMSLADSLRQAADCIETHMKKVTHDH